MSKYPEGLPEPNIRVPVFRRAEALVLKAIPVEPKLEVKWAEDVENKEGWTLKEAMVDAHRDGFKAGVAAYKKVAGDEWEEWIDWNMEKALYEVRIPKLGFKVWTLRVKHIAKWLKKRLNG